MTISELASALSGNLREAETRQMRLERELANELERAYDALIPLISLMKQFKLPYKNDLVDGWTRHGILVGETRIDGNRHLVAYDGARMRIVEPDTDAPIKQLEVAEWLASEEVNLKHMISGFVYVRYLDTNALAEANAQAESLVEALSQLRRICA